MIGKVISHYKILAKLGEGGMGVVYKVLDVKLDRHTVLKFLPPDLTRDRQAKERFIIEAKAASSLDHPNVCTIYEINETDDEQLFIAMAYYEGETLKEKVASGQLSVNSVIEIATQIASGLSRAHEAGIVHRDIKPSNLVITKRNEVKIIDFGLAKLAGQQHLTKSGATLGTVAYMSPEQAQGMPVDHRTDIWSLGVVMYEMLTGQLPFQGHYDQAVMYAIVNTDPQPVMQLRPETPEGLAQVVGKALNKNPAERYQHIDELLDELKAGGKQSASKALKQSPPSRKPALKKRGLLFIGATILLAALIYAGIHFLPKSPQRFDAIAVLPLQNLSGDPEQEYFADGMTEALIANLAKIKSLRVISRTSVMQFKNTREPLPEIAKKLNVDAVVEGSVTLAEGRVRVTAQLLDAVQDRHLWAENYDRNLRDVLALQSEVTDAIVSELRVQLTPQEQQLVTNVWPVDPEAYQLYLKGRAYINDSFAFEKALEAFQKATHLDPTFAEAYAGLALSYIAVREAYMVGKAPPQEIFPRAKAAALKAVALDNTIGEAYAALGNIKFHFDWDWQGAEQDFQHALKLEPQNTEILFHYSFYLVLRGRFDEGIAMRKRAIELDPLSALFGVTLGWCYRFARRYDEGIAHLREWIKMYPSQEFSYNYHIASNYVEAGMYPEAIAAGKKAGVSLQLAYIYAVSGKKAEALALLEELLEISKREYVEPMFIVIIYAALGDKEQAMQWLQKGYENRTPYMTYLKTEPGLDPLRSDPRFVELCRKMGLEE